MPGFLTPDTGASTIADLDRRLRTLEATAKVGISRIKMAWNTGTSQNVGTFDSWYAGPAGATWQDSAGATGTGYPQVTVRTMSKVIVIAQGFAENLANDAAYKSYAWALGVGLDGAAPPNSITDRYQTHGPLAEGNNYMTAVAPILDLTPGTHTFYFSTYWNTSNPGGIPPKLGVVNNAILMVLPID